MAERTLLFKGDSPKNNMGKQVEGAQGLLWDVGAVGPDNDFWAWAKKKHDVDSPEHPKAKKLWADGHFGGMTEEAVMHSQLRLLAQRGIPLEEVVKLGVIDLDTWYALEHPDVKQEFKREPTTGLPLGATIVNVWDHYIDMGVKEIPNGSNRGPYVDPHPDTPRDLIKHGGIDFWTGYNPKVKAKGPAHCCYDRCGIEREAMAIVSGEADYVHSDGRIGLCYNNYKWGKAQKVPSEWTKYYGLSTAAGWVVDLADVTSGRVELPVGSCCIMNYGGTRGHTFTVAAVIKNEKGLPIKVQTKEGNIGNKLDDRERDLRRTNTIKWFVVSPQLLKEADFKGIRADGVTAAHKGESTR